MALTARDGPSCIDDQEMIVRGDGLDIVEAALDVLGELWVRHPAAAAAHHIVNSAAVRK